MQNRNHFVVTAVSSILFVACSLINVDAAAQTISPRKPTQPQGGQSTQGLLEGRPIEGAMSSSDQAVIDEINEIRKQLGGGIASQLKDVDINLSWKSEAEPTSPSELKANFDDELGRLVSTRGEEPAESKALKTKTSTFPGKVQPHVVANAPARIQQLRDSAQRLEVMAAEMEQLGMFEEADKLRHQAGEFWHKSRRLVALPLPK